MKEKEATKVILHFGQVKGLKVKNMEIKRLELSFTSLELDIWETRNKSGDFEEFQG